MILAASALTTAGRRSNNEDAHLVCPDIPLFAVADGMGGYELGEVASRVALDELATFVRALTSDRDRTWPNAWDPNYSPAENLIDQALLVAHRAVVEARPSGVRQMGTTVAALYLEGDTLVIGHVGDSRVYRWRDGALVQLTRDHSMIEELRASGVMGPNDVMPGFAHMITRALGIDGWSRPAVLRERVQPGDRYLLCTDGLSGVVDGGELAALLIGPSRQVAERLLHEAIVRGSNDNVTAVLVDVSLPAA